LRRAIALPSIIESRARGINQEAWLRGKATIVVRANRNPRDATRDAVEIDRHRFRRGWCCWFSFGGLLAFTFFLLGRRAFFFRFGHRHFIAFRRERVLHVLTQRHRVEIDVSVGCVIEFDVGNLRREFSLAGEIKVIACRIPNRAAGIEHVVGEPI
jgi:hypothetical protein